MPSTDRTKSATAGVTTVLVLIVFGCARFPSELERDQIGDCSIPTEPKDTQVVPGEALAVFEVYDFQQNLVHYAVNSSPITTGHAEPRYSVEYTRERLWVVSNLDGSIEDEDFGFGLRTEGIKDGFYLAKVSILSTTASTCICMNLMLSD